MPRPTPDRLLEIYLADHLAASTAGVALSCRISQSNAATAVAIAPDSHEAGRAALSSGTGWINTPKSTTLQALDANGEILATYPLDSTDQPPANGPVIDNW